MKRTTISVSIPMFLIAISLFTAIYSAAVHASPPPTKEEVEKYKKDGTWEQRVKFYEESEDSKIAPGLIKNLEKFMEKRGRKMRFKNKDGEIIEYSSSGNVTQGVYAPSNKSMPTTGPAVNVLAILIEFPDYPHSVSASDIDNALFGTGNTAQYPYESVTEYYKRSSYGQLNITGNTLGWYTAPGKRNTLLNNTMSQYDQYKAREKIISGALSFYDSTHDYSQYDNDGNGIIDYVIVVWTGPDTGWSSVWWAYYVGTFIPPYVNYTYDGVKMGKYSWNWELYYTSTYSPHVVIHETGHALGLTDYYDYNTGIGPKNGVGGLDMMDHNIGDHNSFSKLLLGWISPDLYDSGDSFVNAQASSVSGDSSIIMPTIPSTSPYFEFYMVQNRNQDINDKTHPGKGLMIWHVDATLNSTLTDFLFNNSKTSHKLIRLMEADGLEEIESGPGTANAGDYYVQGNELSPTTNPNNNTYAGAKTNFKVHEISAPGANMTYRITFDSTPPNSVTDVFDGSTTGVDIDVTYDHSQLSANWPPASDPESGISRYWYSVGTSSGAPNVLPWTDNGPTPSVVDTAISIVDNTTYYFNVKSENGSGLISGVTSSDGLMVLSDAPPIQSDWDPASGNKVPLLGFTLDLKIDREGTCRWSLNDEDYSNMINTCNGAGSHNISCNIDSLQIGYNKIHISCEDKFGHADDTSSNTDFQYLVPANECIVETPKNVAASANNGKFTNQYTSSIDTNVPAAVIDGKLSNYHKNHYHWYYGIEDLKFDFDYSYLLGGIEIFLISGISTPNAFPTLKKITVEYSDGFIEDVSFPKLNPLQTIATLPFPINVSTTDICKWNNPDTTVYPYDDCQASMKLYRQFAPLTHSTTHPVKSIKLKKFADVYNKSLNYMYLVEVRIWDSAQACNPPLPNLQVFSEDITTTPLNPNPCVEQNPVDMTVSAVVKNSENVNVTRPFNVYFYLDNDTTPFDTVNVTGGLAANSSITVTTNPGTLQFTSGQIGLHRVRVEVDYTTSVQDGEIAETEEVTDNISFSSPFGVCQMPPELITVECQGIPGIEPPSKHYDMPCYAYYTQGGPNTNYYDSLNDELWDVAGASTSVYIQNGDGDILSLENSSNTPSMHTNYWGDFIGPLDTPATSGVYFLTAEVTDTTFTGWWQQEFIIPTQVLDLATHRNTIEYNAPNGMIIGEPITFSADVFNISMVNATSNYNTSFYVYDSSGSIVYYEVVSDTSNGLSAGLDALQKETVSTSNSFVGYSTTGRYCLHVRVNEDHLIPDEYTFSNNNAVECFYLGEPKPNLTVALQTGTFGSTPTAPIIGVPMTVAAKVCNKGSLKYDPAVYGVAKVELFEDSATFPNNENDLTTAINPGDCVELPFTWTPPGVDRTALKAIVDSTYIVPESVEIDNWATLNFPDLAVTAIYIPGSPQYAHSPAVGIPISRFRGYVENIAKKSMPTSPFSLRVELRDPSGTPVTIPAIMQPPSSVAFPGVYDFLQGYTFLIAGTWTIELCVDEVFPGAVPEKDNSINNCGVYTTGGAGGGGGTTTTTRIPFEVHDPCPDITYKYYKVAGHGPRSLIGSSPWLPINLNPIDIIALKVTNKGEAPTSDPFDVTVSEILNPGNVVSPTTWSTTYTPTLNPGDVVDITIPNYQANTTADVTAGYDGVSRLSVFLDSGDSNDECEREGNNIAEIALPDLSVSTGAIVVPYNSYVKAFSPARGIAVPLKVKVDFKHWKHFGFEPFNVDWTVEELDSAGNVYGSIASYNSVEQFGASYPPYNPASRNIVLSNSYTFNVANPGYYVGTNWQNGANFRVCAYVDSDQLPLTATFPSTTPATPTHNRVPENDETNNSICEIIHVHEPLPDLILR